MKDTEFELTNRNLSAWGNHFIEVDPRVTWIELRPFTIRVGRTMGKQLWGFCELHYHSQTERFVIQIDRRGQPFYAGDNQPEGITRIATSVMMATARMAK